ncbi:hypothetical protein MWH25_11950 [Natroniella acetigena]|uniref:hypothetical protein n=1 Tax=Natroniella acetigena TaxID=52004 RepID=UPI00200B3E8A|nr:hypothetical protein [Natroniella acetigena]MCK8828440.1 hypothetical protein [Natroniella acetigena]
MKRVVIIMILLLGLVVGVMEVSATEMITGEIVAVNSEQSSILLRSEAGIEEYQVQLNSSIKLNGNQVSLAALRPIMPDVFQQARLKLADDRVEEITAAYKAIPAQIKRVEDEYLVIKNLNTREEIEYQLDQQVELLRNNHQVELQDIQAGDSGLVVLGLEDKLQKVIIHNYEISGIVTGLDSDNKRVEVNVGTRLEPETRTYQLGSDTMIVKQEEAVGFEELDTAHWVKLEFKQGVKQINIKHL